MSIPAASWLVRLCRADPDAAAVASHALSQGATVIWCDPACPDCHGAGNPEEGA